MKHNICADALFGYEEPPLRLGGHFWRSDRGSVLASVEGRSRHLATWRLIFRFAGVHKYVGRRNGISDFPAGTVEKYKQWIPSANRDAVNRLPTLKNISPAPKVKKGPRFPMRRTRSLLRDIGITAI